MDNPVVDNPVVDNPVVDSPVVDNPVVDSHVVDIPAAAVGSSQLHCHHSAVVDVVAVAGIVF